MLVILGFESMVIDSADLYVAADATAGDFIDPSSAPSTTMKTVQPKEWMPWTFLSVGAIILLYGVTLPKRWSGDDH
ncbi:MAG: hypothetical protein AAFP69_11720 [Planctomycetota bacterium]